MQPKQGRPRNHYIGRGAASGPSASESGQSRLDRHVWHDLVYTLDDLNLGSVGAQAAAAHARPPSIEDLVFDPANQTFECAEGRAGGVKLWLGRAWQGLREKALVRLWSLDPKKAAICSLGVLGVVLLIGYLYWEPYYVETKLLFIDSDGAAEGKGKAGLPVEREIELLKNVELVDFLAGDTFRRVYGEARRGGTGPAALAQWDSGEAAPTADEPRFSSPGQFSKWLQKALAFRTEASGGVGKATLRLAGGQPDFLKTVMAAYVDGYAEHRRMLETEGRLLSQNSPRSQPRESEAQLPKLLYEQLDKIELQRQRYQLALHFLDSGTGAFSGFVPDGNVTGASSLAQFQDRIVQLEIKKRGLEVQFTPESREIRSLDMEIQGVKRAMRECLVEQIAFLKRGKEQLLAQHDPEGAGKGMVRAGLADGKSLSESDIAGNRALFVIKAGLYMLRDRPAVTKRPLLVKAGDLTHWVAACFLPTRAGSAVAQTSTGARGDANACPVTGGAGQSGRNTIAKVPGVSSKARLSQQETGRLERGGHNADIGSKRTSTREDYWECVPASHFGEKPLW